MVVMSLQMNEMLKNLPEETRKIVLHALTPKPIEEADKQDVVIGVTFFKPISDYKTGEEFYVKPIYGQASFDKIVERFVYSDDGRYHTRVTHFLPQILFEEHLTDPWVDYN